MTGPTGFSAGTRRIRSGIHIECIPGDDFIPCPAGFNDNEFFTGDGTCEGDSGSSAFDDKSVLNNKPVSFGVLSRGGDNAGDAGQAATLCKGGLYTRLDKFRDLVIQAADSASANWTLYPKPVPDWTVYVPPPADAGVDAATKPPGAARRRLRVRHERAVQEQGLRGHRRGQGLHGGVRRERRPDDLPGRLRLQGRRVRPGSRRRRRRRPPPRPARRTTTSGCSVTTTGSAGTGTAHARARRRRPGRAGRRSAPSRLRPKPGAELPA